MMTLIASALITGVIMLVLVGYYIVRALVAIRDECAEIKWSVRNAGLVRTSPGGDPWAR